MFITPIGLAKRWGVRVDTLAAKRSELKGPRYLKLEGKIVYRWQDILDYEAAHLVGTVDQPIEETKQAKVTE